MNEFGCIGSQLQHTGSSLCYTESFCWLVLALRLWYACSVSQWAGLVAPQHVESKSPDRDWNCVPHIARQTLNYWATRKIPTLFFKATDKWRNEKRHHHSILTLPCVTKSLNIKVLKSSLEQISLVSVKGKRAVPPAWLTKASDSVWTADSKEYLLMCRRR